MFCVDDVLFLPRIHRQKDKNLVGPVRTGCYDVFGKKNNHQRGALIMAQNILPFQYEAQPGETGMTGLGGLPLYLDLMCRMNLHQTEV